jgi:hypothetical protein
MPPSRPGGIVEMTRHVDTKVKRGWASTELMHHLTTGPPLEPILLILLTMSLKLIRLSGF